MKDIIPFVGVSGFMACVMGAALFVAWVGWTFAMMMMPWPAAALIFVCVGAIAFFGALIVDKTLGITGGHGA